MTTLPLLVPLLFSIACFDHAAVAQSRTTRTVGQLSSGSPFPLVHDDARQRLVFALGEGELVEWDGASWAIGTARLPGFPIAGTYDPSRQRSFFLVITPFDVRLVEYDGALAIDRGTVPTSVQEVVADTARGLLVAWGIDGVSGLAVLQEWNGQTWTVRTTAPFAGSSLRGMAFDEARGVTVILLDVFQFGATQETWEWDGTNLTLRQSLPIALTLGRLGYDPIRQQVVTSLNGTFAWNGTTWTAIVPPAAGDNTLAFATDRTRGVLWRCSDDFRAPPIARLQGNSWSGAMAYAHPSRHLGAGRLMFHEGRDRAVFYSAFSAVTAEWDGFRWTEQALTPSPQPRLQHACVYDAARAKIVLFGGSDALTGAPLGDTWTFDGAWQLASMTGPSPRFSPTITDDRTRGRVVLIGGGDNLTLLSDRWEWDGNSWQQTGVGTGWAFPGAALGYDEARQRLVLQSGTDTWEQVGAAWQLRASSQFANLADANLTWNVGRQRLQMLTANSELVEWDGSRWLQRGAGFGEPAYDRLRRRLYVCSGRSLEQWSDLPAAAFDFGSSCGNNRPTLLPFGLPHLGNAAFHIDLRAAGGAQFAAIALGLGQGNVALGGGCTLFVQQEIASVVAVTNAAGFLHLPAPVPNLGALLGLTVTLQGGVLDATAPLGFALSRGLRLVLGD